MISNDSITNLFLARFSVKNKPRIGVQKSKYRDYYDYSYYHKLDDMRHIIRNTLELLEAFGLDSERANGFAPPFVDDKTLLIAETFLDDLKANEPGKLNIGYNLSVGNPTRVWDKEKSRRLVETILGSGNYRVVVLTAPPDRSRGDELAGQFNKNVVQIPPGLNLMAVSAILARLDLLITPDTSLVHIARSFKVPVVGLYPKPVRNFLLWHPYEQKEGAVLSGNNDNIFDITVEQVFETFMQVVNNHRLVSK